MKVVFTPSTPQQAAISFQDLVSGGGGFARFAKGSDLFFVVPSEQNKDYIRQAVILRCWGSMNRFEAIGQDAIDRMNSYNSQWVRDPHKATIEG